jgi:hypothetical protein
MGVEDSNGNSTGEGHGDEVSLSDDGGDEGSGDDGGAHIG